MLLLLPVITVRCVVAIVAVAASAAAVRADACSTCLCVLNSCRNIVPLLDHVATAAVAAFHARGIVRITYIYNVTDAQ